MLHKKHHSKRLVGEWFSLTDDDITNFKSDCLKLHEAFEYLKQTKNPFI